jgi:hypothetical protein
VPNASGRLINGQCRSKGDNARRALDRRQQRRNLGLDFEHDVGATSRHERHIARELDGVAEPLLGVEKNRLPSELLLAQPERLRKIALVLLRGAALPPPLVFFPPDGVVAGT